MKKSMKMALENKYRLKGDGFDYMTGTYNNKELNYELGTRGFEICLTGYSREKAQEMFDDFEEILRESNFEIAASSYVEVIDEKIYENFAVSHEDMEEKQMIKEVKRLWKILKKYWRETKKIEDSQLKELSIGKNIDNPKEYEAYIHCGKTLIKNNKLEKINADKKVGDIYINFCSTGGLQIIQITKVNLIGFYFIRLNENLIAESQQQYEMNWQPYKVFSDEEINKLRGNLDVYGVCLTCEKFDCVCTTPEDISENGHYEGLEPSKCIPDIHTEDGDGDIFLTEREKIIKSIEKTYGGIANNYCKASTKVKLNNWQDRRVYINIYHGSYNPEMYIDLQDNELYVRHSPDNIFLKNAYEAAIKVVRENIAELVK